MSRALEHRDEDATGCPVERALEGASPKVIRERLREMEAAGLLTRTAHAEVPPRIDYALSDKGRALRPIIESLSAWGATLPRGQRSQPPRVT